MWQLYLFQIVHLEMDVTTIIISYSTSRNEPDNQFLFQIVHPQMNVTITFISNCTSRNERDNYFGR